MADADAMSRHPGLTSTENEQKLAVVVWVDQSYLSSYPYYDIHRHFTDKCRSYESDCGIARYEVCRISNESNSMIRSFLNGFTMFGTNRNWKKEQLPLSPYHSALLRSFDKVVYQRWHLCREVNSVDSQVKYQVVVPNSLVPDILYYLHNDMVTKVEIVPRH